MPARPQQCYVLSKVVGSDRMSHVTNRAPSANRNWEKTNVVRNHASASADRGGGPTRDDRFGNDGFEFGCGRAHYGAGSGRRRRGGGADRGGVRGPRWLVPGDQRAGGRVPPALRCHLADLRRFV